MILFLFNFNVGVSIPFSIENFSLITKNFFIFSIFANFYLYFLFPLLDFLNQNLVHFHLKLKEQ